MGLLSSIGSSLGNVFGKITGSSNLSQGYGQAQESVEKYLPQATGALEKYYGKAQEQLTPFVQQGITGIKSLADLMANPSAVTETPQYQFQLSEGLRGIQQQNAALGKYFSGQNLRDIQKFGQGLASTSYQQQFQNLAGLTTQGQQAAGTLATLGVDTGRGIAGAYTGTGENLASLQASQGRDIASGKMGILKDIIGAGSKFIKP